MLILIAVSSSPGSQTLVPFQSCFGKVLSPWLSFPGRFIRILVLLPSMSLSRSFHPCWLWHFSPCFGCLFSWFVWFGCWFTRLSFLFVFFASWFWSLSGLSLWPLRSSGGFVGCLALLQMICSCFCAFHIACHYFVGVSRFLVFVEKDWKWQRITDWCWQDKQWTKPKCTGKHVIKLSRQRLFYLSVESEWRISSSPYKCLIDDQPFGDYVHLPAILVEIVACSSQRFLELCHRHATSVLALGNHTEDELVGLRVGWFCHVCLECIRSFCLNLVLKKAHRSLWKTGAGCVTYHKMCNLLQEPNINQIS